MPTKKQRRRAAKEKRHEYETVWLDAEGNELEEPPDGDEAPARATRGKVDGKAAAAAQKQKGAQRRGGRTARQPLPPSWQRASRRSLILGAVVFVLFYLSASKSGSRLVSALALAVLYTVLFIPFTYAIDRFSYQRWLRRQQGGGKPPRKR